MKLFGLTGGIGMGKSTCAELLVQAGMRLVDTDSLARDLTQPGMPALTEIISSFGPSIVDDSGRLQRDSLAQIVFREPSARQQLEAILHPRITAAWRKQVDEWKAAGVAAGVVVIPLLFETGAESCFEVTVCVACSQATQAKRLASRGWSSDESERRMAAQMPIEQKMQRATRVIWNEGTIEVLAEQARRIFAGSK